MLPDDNPILLCHSGRQALQRVRAVCLHVGVPSVKLAVLFPNDGSIIML